MDAGQYYITTITNAAMKLGPLLFYLFAGYFLFIKLPFLLYLRTLKKPHLSNQGQEDLQTDPAFQKKMEEERRREFEERMKNLGGDKRDEKKQEAKKKEERREEKKREEKREQKFSQGKQEKARPRTKESGVTSASAEEILFKLKPGQVFTGQELKKMYHQLLQENHPDKFRTDHQKEFAEEKTKNINEAYQKLKKRVP